MRIAIYGAGAVGGHLAVRLALAGHDLSIVARGEHLDAIRRNGLTLLSPGEMLTVHPEASDRPADLGRQDLVISALKSNALGALVDGLPPLLGPDTPVIFAQNGIPWWYAKGLVDGAVPPPHLPALDPGGHLAKSVAIERIVGCVIASQNDRPEPGVVQHHGASNQFVVGEIDDTESERIAMLRALLAGAGVQSPAVPAIRGEIWTKLLRNAANSYLGLITGGTTRTVQEDEHLAQTRARLIEEGVAIAAAHGFEIDPGRIAAGGATDHKASILQDYEAGRPMEIESLVRAPRAFARAAGIATPTLDSVTAIILALAARKGLGPEA